MVEWNLNVEDILLNVRKKVLVGRSGLEPLDKVAPYLRLHNQLDNLDNVVDGLAYQQYCLWNHLLNNVIYYFAGFSDVAQLIDVFTRVPLSLARAHFQCPVN